VFGHSSSLTSKRIDNEADPVGRKAFNAFLDDMVAMLIFNAFDDVTLQLANQKHLLFDGNRIQCLLHDPAPIHLERKLQDLSHQLLREDTPLLGVSILKELLYHVVSENIGRQLRHLLKHLLKGNLLLLVARNLELLLYQPGAILILGYLADMSREFREINQPFSCLQVLDERAGGLWP